ncbi:MAG: hypothetical protein JRC60_00500 [Deltaproteobacteria bacterium]|nr:hypothetical protein [Deltaproteobacteria bacterium]
MTRIKKEYYRAWRRKDVSRAAFLAKINDKIRRENFDEAYSNYLNGKCTNYNQSLISALEEMKGESK